MRQTTIVRDGSRSTANTVLGVVLGLCVAVAPLAAQPGAAESGTTLADALELVEGTFDTSEALELCTTLDRYYRVRGNEGYMHGIEQVVRLLEAAGFNSDPRDVVELRQYGPVRPAWTPESARLEVYKPDVGVLHEFTDESGDERTFVCPNSFPTDLDGLTAPVIRYDPSRPVEAYAGTIVYHDEWSAAELFRRAVVDGGAWGVISGYMPSYNEPDRYSDAIRYSTIPYNAERRGFGLNVSPAKARVLERLLASGPVYVKVFIRARFAEARATTVVARIGGTLPEAGTVALAAHLDEPGANDNASGVATLAGMAAGYVRALHEGTVPRPRRSLTFIFGQEFECTREWLASGPGAVDASIIIDMVGEGPDNGAVPLIERVPDPGAIWDRPPLDVHSEWGRGDVRVSDLRGTFLNDYVMSAMRARAEDRDWPVRSNPYEGGSDHESFLERGIPSVLMWHFTDPYYHTSLDRMDKVDGEEMKNCAVAAMGFVHHFAHAGLDAAEEVLDIVMAAAQNRLRTERDNALAFLSVDSVAENEAQRDAVFDRERQILQAWGRWYREAVLSIEGFEPQAIGDPGWPAFQDRVDSAVHEIRELERQMIETL